MIRKTVKGNLCKRLTADVRSVMNNRDKQLRKVKRTKKECEWAYYKTLRNSCNALIKKLNQNISDI